MSLMECIDLLMSHPFYHISHPIKFIALGQMEDMRKRLLPFAKLKFMADDDTNTTQMNGYDWYLKRPASMELMSYW
jgi:hypothetical protein